MYVSMFKSFHPLYRVFFIAQQFQVVIKSEVLSIFQTLFRNDGQNALEESNVDHNFLEPLFIIFRVSLID